MKAEWINACVRFVEQRGDVYTHYRKIFRNVQLDFQLDDELRLADAGYSTNKLSQLHRLYFHEESTAAGIFLWDRLREKKKYGSVGVTTYNHFMKSKEGKRSNTTMMGPCLQSYCLTYLDKAHVHVDAFYRTTELFKKFPADLVFIRDTLLPQFDLEGMQVTGLTCYFANLSITANYFMTLVPFLADPIKLIDRVRRKDPQFFKVALLHWLNVLCCADQLYRIQNHSQSMRVHIDIAKRVDKSTVREIAAYVRKHRGPMKRRTIFADDNED